MLIGTSIVFSTLHSHQHIEWNHPESHLDTGNCLTDNSNVCPICGYLFDAQMVEPTSVTGSAVPVGLIVAESDDLKNDQHAHRPRGRSPPRIG